MKDWALVLSMLLGASAYIIYHSIPELHAAGPALEKIVTTLQPLLIFLMLFFAFSKVDPRHMLPHRWMVPLLLIQVGVFTVMSLVLYFVPMSYLLKIVVETVMICFICPTATACAVVTGKLGGDVTGVVTYTIIINLAVAVVVPLLVPLVHPVEGLTFLGASFKIIAKVFPMLIVPFLLAWLIRAVSPKAHDWLVARSHWALYIWTVSLSLAILMSTRAIIRSDATLQVVCAIAVISLICCSIQFVVGRRFGGVTTSQALGQKNTVFAIWLSYTFLDPVVSVAGGFYSIWHNVHNSVQMKKKRDEVQA